MKRQKLFQMRKLHKRMQKILVEWLKISMILLTGTRRENMAVLVIIIEWKLSRRKNKLTIIIMNTCD